MQNNKYFISKESQSAFLLEPLTKITFECQNALYRTLQKVICRWHCFALKDKLQGVPLIYSIYYQS